MFVANFIAARRWGYSENLAAAAPMVRQVFYVHCAYIVVIIGALAILCLGWPSLLLEDGMGRVLSGQRGVAGSRTPGAHLVSESAGNHGCGGFLEQALDVGYSQMMQRLVGRPVEKLAGAETGIMAVFVVSGLLHELAITLPVCSGFGLPTLYFTLHGAIVLLEKKCGRSIGKIPTLLIVMVPLGLLFPPHFQTEIIARCLGVFDAAAKLIRLSIRRPPVANLRAHGSGCNGRGAIGR